MSALTVEAKSTMRANLELELNARKDKLLAMCEAQVASLRSRLERRVNRIPMNKRSMNIMDLIDPKAAKQDVAPVKEPAISSKRTRPVARPAPARAAASRAAATSASAPVCHPATSITQKVQACQQPQHDHVPESRQLSQPQQQQQQQQQQAQTHQSSQPRKQAATRGVKRSSNEMASDKENMAEQLSVPKKRAKLPVNRAAPAPRNPRTNAAEPAPVRTTRAASRKMAAPEVLSPKSSNARTNSRTIAPARATRRAR